MQPNAGFFNTPFKKKGDIEIYTSLSHRGNTSTKYSTDKETPKKEFAGNVSIYESPDKTYKYVISDYDGESGEKYCDIDYLVFIV